METIDNIKILELPSYFELLSKKVHFEDFQDFLSSIQHAKYTFSRDWTLISSGGFKDLDFMVYNLTEFASLIGAIPNVNPYEMAYYNNVPGMASANRVKYVIKIGMELVHVDIRYVGDNYIDPVWMKQMLETREFDEDLHLHHPNQHYHCWFMIYHELIHKGIMRDHRYGEIQNICKHSIIGVESIPQDNKKIWKEKLDAFMKKENFSYFKPKDVSVGFHV